MPWIYKPKFINEGANTQQVTTAPGAVKSIMVGNAVAGNVAIWDSATANANQVCQINTVATGYYILDARISNGLRVTYPANCALTIMYQ